MSTTPTPAPDFYSQAVRDVLAERVRQIRVEGWTAEHDDAEHGAGELAMAAGCYALACDGQGASSWIGQFWPFARKWWKPGDPRRMLVKAAALIIAEIERRDRAAGRAEAGAPPRSDGEAWIAETDAAGVEEIARAILRGQGNGPSSIEVLQASNAPSWRSAIRSAEEVAALAPAAGGQA